MSPVFRRKTFEGDTKSLLCHPHQEWKEKLSKIESLTITVSDVLEKNATDKERLNHIDIADWLIKWRQECIRQFGGTDAVPFAGHNHSTWDKTDINPENCPTFANPNMQFVTQYFPNTGLNFKNLSMS